MSARPVLLALVLALTACATGGPRNVTDQARPHAVGEGSAISVRWGDPAQFAELRYSQNRRLAAQGDWVVELADYMQEKLAKAVPAGERVDVRDPRHPARWPVRVVSTARPTTCACCATCIRRA